jgi:hypothetical protein
MWMVLTYTAYFRGYSILWPIDHYFMKSFFGVILSFFAVLGIPFTFRLVVPAAIAAGILLSLFGILLTIHLIIEKRVVKYIFPLCLVYFGYTFCGAVAIGRSEQSGGGVLASRYATFSLFVLIGLMIIIYAEYFATEKPEKLKYIAVLVIRFLLIVLLLQYFFVGELIDKAYVLKIRQFQMLDYKNQILDTLRSSYPWTDIDSAHEMIETLKKNRWSVFYRKLSGQERIKL